MKKGISLIVLVITIIVMIIIAGAIIISLNSTNVISQANDAVAKSDLANAKYAASLVYADIMVANNNDSEADDVDSEAAQTLYDTAVGTGFTVTVDTQLRPVVTVATAQ